MSELMCGGGNLFHLNVDQFTPENVEIFAPRHGVVFAKNHGFRVEVAECDALLIVQSIPFDFSRA